MSVLRRAQKLLGSFCYTIVPSIYCLPSLGRRFSESCPDGSTEVVAVCSIHILVPANRNLDWKKWKKSVFLLFLVVSSTRAWHLGKKLLVILSWWLDRSSSSFSTSSSLLTRILIGNASFVSSSLSAIVLALGSWCGKQQQANKANKAKNSMMIQNNATPMNLWYW